ncbi:MAG: alpha/beta fold hydrolase [Granulosicoccus sp.]
MTDNEDHDSRYLGARFSDRLKCLVLADGSEIKVRPQCLLVFQCLANQAGHVVSKQTVFDAVWGNKQVTEDSLTQCISELRRALGDDDHKTLRTVPRQGYRLVADKVEEHAKWSELSDQSNRAVAATVSVDAIDQHVTPRFFQPRAFWLVLPLLVVAAIFTLRSVETNSSSASNNKSADDVPTVFLTFDKSSGNTIAPPLKAIVNEARVAFSRYRSVVLRDDASADYQLRITSHAAGSGQQTLAVEVTQRSSGNVLFAESLDIPESDNAARELGIRIAAMVAAPGVGAIGRHLLAASNKKPVSELSRAECYANGYDCTNCSGELDSITRRAEACLADIIEEHPTDARAWALQSTVYAHQYQWGTNLPEPQRSNLAERSHLPALAIEAANRAEKLSDGGDSAVYWAMVQAYGAACDIDKMQTAIDRGLQINPDDPSMLAAFGNFLAYAGQWDEGVELVERALEIEPRHYKRWWLFALAKRHYIRGEYEQALGKFKQAFNERNWLSHLQMAYTLPYLGRLEEARKAVRNLQLIAPGMTVEQALQTYRIYCFPDTYLEKMKQALIEAGLPSRGSSSNFNDIFVPHARIIQINGTSVEYMDLGEGVPVVFVHGAISDYRSWTHYQNLISEKYRYLSYSRRYFGSQQWIDGGENYSIHVAADDLIAFIEALNLESVFLVSWSSGAKAASIAAIKRPDLIQGIVHYEPVVDSLADLDDSETPVGARDKHYGGFDRVDEFLTSEDPEGAVKSFLETVFELHPGQFETEVMPIRMVVLDSARTLPLMSGSVSPGPPITCDYLAAMQTPTLVVYGTKTNQWWQYLARRYAECAPNVMLKTISGVNHAGPIRKPDVLFALISEFIDQQVKASKR